METLDKKMLGVRAGQAWGLGVFDTLSDSIQCLNFAKKWFIQYSIKYCFVKDSIQNIIQFKINSADSIQKIIQFNCHGIIGTGRIGKVPKNAQKVSKIDKIWFIHSLKKINSKDYSIKFFPGMFNSKSYSKTFFPRKFNSYIESTI